MTSHFFEIKSMGQATFGNIIWDRIRIAWDTQTNPMDLLVLKSLSSRDLDERLTVATSFLF